MSDENDGERGVREILEALGVDEPTFAPAREHPIRPVRHMWGPEAESLSNFEKVIDAYRRGEIRGIACVATTADGEKDFMFFDANATTAQLSRLLAYLCIVQRRVTSTLERDLEAPP